MWFPRLELHTGIGVSLHYTHVVVLVDAVRINLLLLLRWTGAWETSLHQMCVRRRGTATCGAIAWSLDVHMTLRSATSYDYVIHVLSKR